MRRKSFSGQALTRYRSPGAWTKRPTISSDLVSRPLFAFIETSTPSEDGQGCRMAHSKRR